LHIAAHYHGGGATPTPEGRDDVVDSVLTAISEVNGGDMATALHRKLTASNSSQRHANSAPNHSPDVPEESHTLACPKASSDSPLSNCGESNAGSRISTPPLRYYTHNISY
uniref:Pecanex-like protein n=1 Tax=Anisakis simplex TaxID=6269 RepID=A0A0M3JLB2_ANISI